MVFNYDKSGINLLGLGRTSEYDYDQRSDVNRASFRGKSFYNMRRDYSSGQGLINSVFSTKITESDIAGIKAYNEAIKNGIPTGQAWRENMKGCSVAAKQAVRDTGNQREALDKLANTTDVVSAKTKLASLGMKALSIAGSMLATMLISMAFQAVITGLDNIAHASEHAKEALDDFHQKVKEGRDKFKEQYEFINSDEAKKLDELSRGVDAYGNSISLSAEQFTEYHSIANKVADMFPTMVKGWDSQGNAILNNVDVLKKLNDEYKKAQYNHYNEITKKTTDIKNEYSNYTNGALGGFLIGKQEEIEALEEYIHDGFKSSDGTMRSSAFLSAIKGTGINLKDFKDLSGDIAKQQRIIAQLQGLKNEQDAAFASMKELVEAHAYITKQGYDLTDDQSSIIDNFVNLYTYENSSGKTPDKMINEVNEFIKSLADNHDLSIDLAKLIKIDPNSISEADLHDMWKDMLKRLKDAGFSDTIVARISSIGVDDFKYEKRTDKLKELVGERADEIKHAFNSKELDLILNGDITVGDKSIDDLRKEIEEKMKANQPEVEVKLKARLEKLGEMSDAFKTLKSAMDEVSDEGKVTFSTVEALAEKLGDDIVEKYADTLLDASSSAKDLGNAIRGMAQDYIEAKITSGEFNENTEKEIASMLDEAGVANSTAVAHDMVARAKLRNLEMSLDLTKINDASISSFLEEARTIGLTETAIGQLSSAFGVAQTAMTNAQKNGAIERLHRLGIELRTIQDVANAYRKIFEATGYATSDSQRARAVAAQNPGQRGEKAREAVSAWDDVKEVTEAFQSIDTAIDNIMSSFGTTPTFKPSDKKDKTKDKSKDADKAQKDYDKTVKDINKQLEDLAKSEALQQLKYKFDDLERSINKISDALSNLDNIMSMQADDDYIGKLMTTTMQIDLTQQKTALLRDEFTKLNAETPISADMAQELANRMKSVADNIATNAKNMHEYGKNVAEYYTSALKSISSTQKATLDKADSLFERNIKSLTEGGLIGLDFRLSPTVPESAYEKQRSENQTIEEEMQRYYDDIAVMQKTALDMQYQEQIADNARKREELYQSLEDAKEKLNEALAEATNIQATTNEQIKAEQKQTNAETSAEQKQDDANKLTEAQNFSTQMETTINDLNNWMLENPVKAPDLDTAAWEGMVSKAKQYAQEIQNAISSATASADFGDFARGDFGEGREALIAAARSQLGYKEGANNANKFSAFFGKGAQAWCNDFVSWAAEQAGLGNEIPEGSYTVDTAKRFRSKGKLFSSNGYTPIPGDIAYYSTGGIEGIFHVEIVTEVGNDGSIKTIGGNTGRNGEVAERVRKDKPAFYGTYAKGTDTFDTYGKNPDGIVGENYKREVIINKKTGEKTVVDEPTLIDTDEYDIVGEKQTAVLDKNNKAKGEPPTDRELLDYIGKASIETGVPANIIMAVMDQESGYTWLRDENGKNGAVRGNTRVYGYMGIEEGLLEGMLSAQASAIKTDPYANILFGARLLLKNFEKLKSWKKALSKYDDGTENKVTDYAKKVLEESGSKPFVDAAKQLLQDIEGAPDTEGSSGKSGSVNVSMSDMGVGMDGMKSWKDVGVMWFNPNGPTTEDILEHVRDLKKWIGGGSKYYHGDWHDYEQDFNVYDTNVQATGEMMTPEEADRLETKYAPAFAEADRKIVLFALASGMDLGEEVDAEFVQYLKTHQLFDPESVKYTYAKGTNTFPVHGHRPNGVVGENYRDEIVINKNTGESSIVNSPALIDTNEYDVVGEKQTAEILRNKHATGTPTSDSQILSYIKKASQETGVPANILMAVMDEESGYIWNPGSWDVNGTGYGFMGLNSSGALAQLKADGYGKLAESAKTDHYSNVLAGAITLSRLYKINGNDWPTAVMRYNGSGKRARDYRDRVISKSETSAFKSAAASLGSISASTGETAESTGETAENTGKTIAEVKEIRRDFRTQLKDFLAGSQVPESEANGFEDQLLGYIKENVQIASDNNEKFIETYDALVAFQDKNADVFRTLDRSLQEAVGTDDYASVREEIHNTSAAYTEEILGMQAKLNVERTKQTYGDNQKALAAARRYYNERRANGANADELSIIVKGIDEILNEAHELSDQYVSEMRAYTDFLVTRAERVTGGYNDQLSWLQKINEESERELDYTEDISKRHAIMAEQTKNYNQQLDINQKKQEAAHQAVLDLYDNEDYAPIFERFDIESWFNADGDFSTQFTKDLEGMSMIMPELVPVMQQIAEQIQTQKKAYYEAGEASDDLRDKLRDLAQQEADEKIDFYIKGRERVREATEFDKAINDTLTDIQQSFYEFKDGLREAQNEIDAQLEANKHLDQWLDPDTRKQLFNEQDYAEESLEIARLLEESDAARADYQEQISNLREDEQWKLEGITAEYNRQMDALKGQLDIAKQRLQTAKDLDAIENARKERDTQIIMGTRSQNVADPDKLYDLEMTAQKSRLELTNLETKQTEADDIRERQAISSQMGTIIESIGYVVDAINNLTPEGKKLFAGQLPELEELKGLYYSILKDSPYTILTNDLTEEGYTRLDMNKRIGYDEVIDHSQIAEDVARGIAEGYLPDTLANRLGMHGNMQNHDNKNLTSPYHNGYAYYGNGELLGTDARTLEIHPYSYLEALAQELENDKKAAEFLKKQAARNGNKSVKYGETVFSGNGEVVIPNPSSYKLGDTTITAENVIATDGSAKLDNGTMLTLSDGNYVDISGYKELTMQEMMENLGLGAFARDSLAIGTSDYLRLFEMEKILGGLDNVLSTVGSTDNSQNFHIDNVQIVDPTDTNAFVNDLLNQVKDIAKITKK